MEYFNKDFIIIIIIIFFFFQFLLVKSFEIFTADRTLPGKSFKNKKGRGYIERFFCKVVVVAGQTPVFQWF